MIYHSSIFATALIKSLKSLQISLLTYFISKLLLRFIKSIQANWAFWNQTMLFLFLWWQKIQPVSQSYGFDFHAILLLYLTTSKWEPRCSSWKLSSGLISDLQTKKNLSPLQFFFFFCVNYKINYLSVFLVRVTQSVRKKPLASTFLIGNCD